jgi:carbon storage regulator CsrA
MICLKIIEVVGNKVRLGIEAPDDILILRKELADKNIEFIRKKEQKPVETTNMIE